MTTDPRDPADAWHAAVQNTPRRVRERDLRRYGPRRGPSTWIYWTIAVVGLVLFVVLMRGVMEKTRWTAGPTVEPSESTPPRGATGPTRIGCFERVDAYSRTWVDRCGGSHGPPTPTERAAMARVTSSNGDAGAQR